MSPQLEHWLALHYKARVLHAGDLAQVRKTLKDRFEADQALAAEARLELQRIDELRADDPDLKRCFVSKIHREALTRLLPPA